MKKSIIILLTYFSLIAANIYSQQFQFGIESGIGTYQMSALKSTNSDIQKGIPFDTKLVSNFPAYFYYRPTVELVFKHFGIGLNYSFLSTGSRISGKDYSGEYNFDMLIHSNTPSIFGEYYLNPDNKFPISFYLNFGRYYTTLNIKEHFSLGDSTLTNNYENYKAQNFYTEPGMKIYYPYKSFRIGFDIGYALQFSGKGFYLNNNINQKMADSKIPNWSGFRIGISLIYNLK